MPVNDSACHTTTYATRVGAPDAPKPPENDSDSPQKSPYNPDASGAA